VSGSRGVIQLELARAADMFETPAVELGAGFGSSISGIDQCLAELTGGTAHAPVRLDVALPESELTPGLDERITTSLHRYCDEHRRHNILQRRSMQRSGLRALRLGFPITLLGLIVVAIGGTISADDPIHNIVDIIGWVFAWLGLWYPFDKVFFYPTDLDRENRALAALHDATVTVATRSATPGPG
jgi:hypothetical protein